MGTRGGADALEGAAEAWMIELAGDAERDAQVRRANEQDIHSVDRGDRVHRLDALQGLDLQFPKMEGPALKELQKVRSALIAEERNSAGRKL